MSEIDEYIGTLPPPRQRRARALHRLIRRLFPQAQVSLRYRMPTYDLDGHFLAWGNKKNYLSLYTCSAERIAGFRAANPEIPTGVGCLNFRDKDDFPLKDLERVIRNALAPGAALLKRERTTAATARAARRRTPG